MGKDVLWEIRSRRAMASSLQLPLSNVLPAHVISRCLAFWFLVYSQSTLLLLSIYVCVCARARGTWWGELPLSGVAHHDFVVCFAKLLGKYGNKDRVLI